MPALFATILWAGNPTAISLALRDFSGLSLTEVRMAGAVPVLLALTLIANGGLRIPPLTRLPLVLATGAAYGTSVLCLTVGLRYTTAVNATLLFATSPLLTYFIGAILGHEPLARKRLLGASIALVGVAVIVFRHGASLEAGTLPGDLLVLVASFATALIATLQVFLFAELGLLSSTTLVVGIGGILVLPFTWHELVQQNWAVEAISSWAGLLYSVVLAVVVPMVLWNMALRKLGARRTIVYSYLQPVFGAVIAVLVLSEPIGPAHVLGIVLVFLGLALTRR